MSSVGNQHYNLRKRKNRENNENHNKMVPKSYENTAITYTNLNDSSDADDERKLIYEDEDEENEQSSLEIGQTQSSSLDTTIESPLEIAKQVFFPYVMAALGLVTAGLVLDHIQHWNVFEKVNELYVLVPSLLGLKGNLEMTLASRVSTAANAGHIDSPEQRSSMIKGNMALIQCQASVVATLAAIIAMLMSWIPTGEFRLNDAMLLCASSLYTAAIASAVLSFLMMMIIVYSHKHNINPDNVATPIAASLGDLVTLALLAGISRFLYYIRETDYYWILPTSIALFFIVLPLWIWLANSNEFSKKVLREGWEPVIAAMFISSTGGFILEKAVTKFSGIAIYTPCMNGVGGNLAAIQASRISTYLHCRGKPGQFIPDYMKTERNCDCTTFTSAFNFRSKNPHQISALVLWLMTIPGHAIVLTCFWLASTMGAGHTTQTPLFIVVYMLTAVLQVGVLLKLTLRVTHTLWNWGDDPDNSAIPYLTAFGDLLGQVLLFGAFSLLFLLGDRDEDVGE